MYEIVIGRTEAEKRKFGLDGTIFIGKMYVRMGATTSLSNKVLLDVVNPHIILVTGKRGCLPGDHKIFTNTGYKEIKDFNEKSDKIMSFNKNELEFIWKDAKLYEYDIKKEYLTKLTLQDGREITITDEHPLLVFHKNAVLVWRKGKDLREGDLLVNTTFVPEVSNDKESLRIARLLGFTLADGNIFIQKGRFIQKISEELKKYAAIAVITDGKNGAYAYDGQVKQSIAARKVDVVETTGAGDAFASSFLAGMILKQNIEFALQIGLANSESVIKEVGAKNTLLSLTRAVSEIREHPAIVKKMKL